MTTQHEQTGGVGNNQLDEPDLVLFKISREVAVLYLKKVDNQQHPEIRELAPELNELLELLQSLE